MNRNINAFIILSVVISLLSRRLSTLFETVKKNQGLAQCLLVAVFPFRSYADKPVETSGSCRRQSIPSIQQGLKRHLLPLESLFPIFFSQFFLQTCCTICTRNLDINQHGRHQYKMPSCAAARCVFNDRFASWLLWSSPVTLTESQ